MINTTRVGTFKEHNPHSIYTETQRKTLNAGMILEGDVGEVINNKEKHIKDIIIKQTLFI